MSAPPPGLAAVEAGFAARARLRLVEPALALVAVACFFAFPDRHLLMAEIAVLALFALSLDLILGYAGIVSLGHAAFLGLGAYAAGIVAVRVTPDPLLGLAAAGIVGGLAGLATSPLVLRGADLTRLMVTLGVALVMGEIANRESWLTGGADGLQGIAMGPVLGFEFDIVGRVANAYALAVLVVLALLARLVVLSPFRASLVAIRDNPLRARAVGIPVNRRLVAIYGLSAAYAGVAGGLLCQTTQFVSLDVFGFERSADVLLVLVIGGTGWLYGGLVGAVLFKLLVDALSSLTPQYWHFWIGLILVVLVLVGRDRMRDGARRLVGRLGPPRTAP